MKSRRKWWRNYRINASLCFDIIRYVSHVRWTAFSPLPPLMVPLMHLRENEGRWKRRDSKQETPFRLLFRKTIINCTNNTKFGNETFSVQTISKDNRLYIFPGCHDDYWRHLKKSHTVGNIRQQACWQPKCTYIWWPHDRSLRNCNKLC